MQFAAACIYAQAIPLVKADPRERNRLGALMQHYQEQALKALEAALRLEDEARRPAFWRQHAGDKDLDPIRQCNGFRELEERYGPGRNGKPGR